MKKIAIIYVVFSLILLNGCAFSKVAANAVGVLGSTVDVAGKIVEGTGKVICGGASAVGKVADAVGRTADTGGKAIEVAANTPGAKEAVASQLLP